MAAAGTCTSSTGTVSGTDPNFILTQKINDGAEQLILYLQYTLGTSTSITVTYDVIQTNLSATDKYRLKNYTGAAATAVSSYTITMDAAANARYVIPLTPIGGERTVAVNISFNGAGTTGVVVANIVEG